MLTIKLKNTDRRRRDDRLGMYLSAVARTIVAGTGEQLVRTPR